MKLLALPYRLTVGTSSVRRQVNQSALNPLSTVTTSLLLQYSQRLQDASKPALPGDIVSSPMTGWCIRCDDHDIFLLFLLLLRRREALWQTSAQVDKPLSWMEGAWGGGDRAASGASVLHDDDYGVAVSHCVERCSSETITDLSQQHTAAGSEVKHK